MATESLNASATEFRPTQASASQGQPQPQRQERNAPAAPSSSSGVAREKKPRGPRNKNKTSNGNGNNGDGNDASTPAPQRQRHPQQQNGSESMSNTTLVPASVRRRRQPANANGKAPASDGNGTATSTDATPKPLKQKKQQPQKQKPNKQIAKQEEDEKDEDLQSDVECCLLCADPIQFHAVGECNHHGICSKCSLRMRMLMNDRNCPICKQHLERVVVHREKRPFESFQLWGDAAAGGRESVMDEASEIIFYECRAHYTALRSLRDFACRLRKCSAVCGSQQKLKDHLRIEHATEFCELCVAHQHFFIQEHQVFTKAGLRAHNIGKNRSVGPKASGKDFHPMCQFCKRRFYSDMQLYEHLERDHFRCHICKIDHDYFRNYPSLETHFRREHHLCEEKSCLENRYVVFPNDIEYHAHMQTIHGVVNRLVLNFQVARTGENPLGGVHASGGADVPDSWSYETQQPVATPLAASTASSRMNQAFPALPSPGGPAPPPLAQPAIAPRASIARSSSAGAASSAAGLSGLPRAQIMRNQRLAEALGLAAPGQSPDAFEQEMKTPNYPTHLVDWARANLGYLQVVERRLERIVQDASCHSVSLRPMPAEERKMMHALAEVYGVPSESFGEDPYRRIQFFKRETAAVPEVTLSKLVRTTINGVRGSASGATASGSSSSASRLSFLPMRGQPPAASSSAPVRAVRPPKGIQRGWEKIAPKPKKPVVADAWSDDEDDKTTGDNEQDEDSTGASRVDSATRDAATSGGDHEDDDEEEHKPAIKTVVLLPGEGYDDDDEDEEDKDEDKIQTNGGLE